jgi:hypothetical protein
MSVQQKTSQRRLCLVRSKIDFRKGHDGLVGAAMSLSLDPYAGDFIIFIGSKKKCFKLLFADSTGLWVQYKKLTSNRIRWFKFLENNMTRISDRELESIVHGTDEVSFI